MKIKRKSNFSDDKKKNGEKRKNGEKTGAKQSKLLLRKRCRQITNNKQTGNRIYETGD